MDCLSEWPEPVVRVQSLSESGTTILPPQYIKPSDQRPTEANSNSDFNIPIVDLGVGTDAKVVAVAVSEACKEWGFFQAVNHGVSLELLHRTREVWREFFHLPMETKESYANSPKTYEGYGSRVGIEKGALLDWGDYFFLHYFPLGLKSHDKWLAIPSSLRETVDEYGREVMKLCVRIMGMLSLGLGLEEERLRRAFGGEEAGFCMRVNYYPKCPQPELALGLSSHSDPGGITVLLPDDKVQGLQVKHRGVWVAVQPMANAFIINVGDQVQSLFLQGFEQRHLLQRGTSRVSELGGRAAFARHLLQPEERPTSGSHSGVGGSRTSSTVSAHDLRPIPTVREKTRPSWEVAGRIAQGRRSWPLILQHDWPIHHPFR